MYKTQKGNLPYILSGVGMVTMLFAGVLLFISVPSMFYLKAYASFNSIPSILLSTFLFLLGYWLNRIFPVVKITSNGIRCKHMYFYGLIKWPEMDNIIELKNGVMALSINRQGSPFLNGLFFEWLTGKALRQNSPVILFIPEFFGDDKTIPQEIIANAPTTSRINEYLREKLNTTGFINPTRFCVQESENGVVIVIPGKKNILEVIFFIPMALLWSYFAAYAIYFFAMINLGVILALFQDSLEPDIFSKFIIIDSILFIFISFILLWVWGVFSATARHMAGTEILEVNEQSITITRQVFRWRRRSEYVSGSTSNLRVNVIKPGVLNNISEGIRTLFGRDGKIVFDFQGKSVRVGRDISEDEGKYLLARIKSRINM